MYIHLHTYVYKYIYIYIYIHICIYRVNLNVLTYIGRHHQPWHLAARVTCKGCEEKHSHTAAHHSVVKPPAEVSTAVSHTPTQQQDWGIY